MFVVRCEGGNTHYSLSLETSTVYYVLVGNSILTAGRDWLQCKEITTSAVPLRLRSLNFLQSISIGVFSFSFLVVFGFEVYQHDADTANAYDYKTATFKNKSTIHKRVHKLGLLVHGDLPILSTFSIFMRFN